MGLVPTQSPRRGGEAVVLSERPAFANAIVIAQRAGETDEEIARVTGYTVPMIRAVLRTPA